MTTQTARFVYDDGGRNASGYRGHTGDCATRAIAIAADLPYIEVYNRINRLAALERPRAGRKRSSAREGVHMRTMNRLLVDEMGWTWYNTMTIGSGCTVHLRASELPSGRLVARCSKHYTAVIGGTIHDTYDPSRDGTRCVYGFWTPF